jgi:hypothetical protein
MFDLNRFEVLAAKLRPGKLILSIPLIAAAKKGSEN